MNPDPMDLLETFAPTRYVALTEAEAAELGAGVYNEWRLATPRGVHVDAADYVDLLRDGSRWRGLVSFAGKVLIGVAVIGGSLLVIGLLGFLARVFG